MMGFAFEYDCNMPNPLFIPLIDEWPTNLFYGHFALYPDRI